MIVSRQNLGHLKRTRSSFWSATRLIAVALIGVNTLSFSVACQKADKKGAEETLTEKDDEDSLPPWEQKELKHQQKEGMVWIPKGALVTGTPPERLPRISDQEMPGLQIVLGEFFIDIYPFPNEPGAIPLTNVSRAEAESHCAEKGKRLCSELEWERACKGPENWTYEYGDNYRPTPCGTGSFPRLRPSGFHPGCRSEFGVRDLHGGVWEWTLSDWGRGTSRGEVSLRGGNSSAGDVTGRCANGISAPPTAKNGTLGFRCCAGPLNDAKVEIDIDRDLPVLENLGAPATDISEALVDLIPESASREFKRFGPMQFKTQHLWRPAFNHEVLVLGGCAGTGTLARCGTLLADRGTQGYRLLAWADAGFFPPAPKLEGDSKLLWIYGGDARGHFRRAIRYLYGRVQVAQVEFNPGKEKTKVTKKAKKDLAHFGSK